MKKYILLTLAAVGTLAFGIGCASVESDDNDAMATRSTTTTSSRETRLSPVAPSASTTTRSTTVQSY